MVNYAVQHRTRAKVPFSGWPGHVLLSGGIFHKVNLPQCGFEFAKKMFGVQVILGDNGHVGAPRQNRFDPGQGLELMTPELLHALVFEVVPYC